MQKLLYALIPLFIHSVAAHKDASASSNLDSFRSREPSFLSLDSLVVNTDEISTPKTIYSETPSSPDSCDLSRYLEWSKKGRRDAHDDTDGAAIDNVHYEAQPHFLACAALLKPYMQKTQSLYSKEEQNAFRLALTEIQDLHSTLPPTERYKIAQQLNVLAIFEGKSTFIKITVRNKKTTQEVVIKTLADKFRVGTSRRYPMQLQCAQIATNTITTEEAALTICDEWENEGIFDKRVKSCKRRLKTNGFYRYEWAHHEIIDLLTFRSEHPRIIGKSKYSEKQINRFCKRIKNKGRNKHQYIENVALFLTEKWKSEGVLNEAVQDCKIKMTRARLDGQAT